MIYLLEDKIEQAALMVAAPGIAWPNLYTGKSAGDIVLPCAIFEAESDGQEEPIHSGNFFVNLVVALCQQSQDEEVQDLGGQLAPGAAAGQVAKGVDQAVVSGAFTALMRDDLPALLSAAVADLTVFDKSCVFSTSRGFGRQGVWRDELHVRMYACGSALAP